MKFPHLSQLQDFIKNQNIFPDYESMHEIYTGGSSYNFCVQTASGKYFLKLLKNVETYNKIKELCGFFYTLYNTEAEIFEDYRILIMPYFEGRKINYTDCSEHLLLQLYEKYKNIQSCQLNSELILPMRSINQLQSDIERILKTSNSIIYRLIYSVIWSKMKQDLIHLQDVNTLIHGDFTANNVLLSPTGETFILDWEQIRYGYITEDWMGFVLELSGFRGLWGDLSHFQKLINIIRTSINFSNQEWLYGIQIFYLTLIQRRLVNHKKQSYRKQLCLLLIMLGYFRIRGILRKLNW